MSLWHHSLGAESLWLEKIKSKLYSPLGGSLSQITNTGAKGWQGWDPHPSLYPNTFQTHLELSQTLEQSWRSPSFSWGLKTGWGAAKGWGREAKAQHEVSVSLPWAQWCRSPLWHGNPPKMGWCWNYGSSRESRQGFWEFQIICETRNIQSKKKYLPIFFFRWKVRKEGTGWELSLLFYLS